MEATGAKDIGEAQMSEEKNYTEHKLTFADEIDAHNAGIQDLCRYLLKKIALYMPEGPGCEQTEALVKLSLIYQNTTDIAGIVGHMNLADESENERRERCVDEFRSSCVVIYERIKDDDDYKYMTGLVKGMLEKLEELK